MSDPAPRVAVVVLNWNNWEDTVECVASCLALDAPAPHLLVVDNGSTDGSEAILRERFPGVEILQTGANLGFTGGNNAGIRHVLAQGADLVVLLNNDTRVDPAFAAALADAARARPDAGMLCSKILFHDRPGVIWYAGASFHPLLGWGRHRGFGEADDGRFDRPEETDRPTGCALAVTRRCCEAVGLLRDDLFCYGEDLEWGLRARDAGFAVLYVPASRVWHKVSRTAGRAGSLAPVRYLTRNLLSILDGLRPLPAPLRLARRAAVLSAAALGLVTQRLPLGRGLSAIAAGADDARHGRMGRIPSP